MNASDVLAEFLEQKKIKHVFGIIGSGNATIWDAILRRGYTEIICVHHEQAAVMAMGTYFRTTGQISASLVTTGAGSTNAVTGVVSAWMDSIPGLIISGNENSKFTSHQNPLRIWGVQGYDSVEMVRKVTKLARRTMEPSQIKAELEEAHWVSLNGRPGPVWVDVPMNVQSAPVEISQLKSFSAPQFKSSAQDQAAKISHLIENFKKAERPVLWLGHGIRMARATSMLDELLKKTQSPAFCTWNGMDLLPEDHPNYFGRAGVYGQRSANFILQNSDFVLAIGTRLALPQVGYDISELARQAFFGVVDIDGDELAKYPSRFDWTLEADAKDFMESFIGALSSSEISSHSEWFEQCRRYQKEFPIIGPEHDDADGFINSYRFMDRLSGHLKPDQHIVTDMGTALLSGHQIIQLQSGQRMMTSTGLGEMGFGLPGAIGVSIARDRGEVMCLNCDGGMMMNLQELQTIAHHQLPIKIFIFNNDGYLMIKHTQKALFKGRRTGVDRATGVSCPDYSKIAQAFGFGCHQIRTWEDFDQVLPQVQEATGPVFCEVFMDPNQLLVPKLALAPQEDGSIISPPLEDLFPFVEKDRLDRAMIIGTHPKSDKIDRGY